MDLSQFETVLEYLANTFLLATGTVVGVGVIALAVMYFEDILQHKHAIRRNFPVIGRARYIFEVLGEFFRQYFFAMDREEMPFNRAIRTWVYTAAKGKDTTSAFGSTYDVAKTTSINFANAMFPVLDKDAEITPPLQFGQYCKHPYNSLSMLNISGMSFGAISKPAVLALSTGAAQAGCWMNTGEGGVSEQHLAGGADLVFQIGTAKYGVRDQDGQLSDEKLREVAAHEQIKMFEIKLSQGAKPGKGGVLPAAKITDQIAQIRHIEKGKDSYSPNRHLDIESSEDLLDMVNRVRTVTGKPTGFKLVLGNSKEFIELVEYMKSRPIEECPDFITIDSADGGTGAAPQVLLDYVGTLIWDSLPLVDNELIRAGLRDRIRIIVSGKMLMPGNIAKALCLGADVCVSARGPMFALGCIQALQCNQNTCPTGITTHNKTLQKGLNVSDKSERVVRYIQRVNYDLGVIAHSCGLKHPRLFQRHHARVYSEDGEGLMGLDQLHPLPQVENINIASETKQKNG